MEFIINNEDKNKKCIVYKVTCYVGSHHKQYHYIGYTKRALQVRFNEHILGKKSAVAKFIRTNDVRKVSIEILQQCEYEQLLDITETKEIAKYILHRGKRSNQRNRLLNILYKGLDKYTIKNLQKLYTNLQEI